MKNGVAVAVVILAVAAVAVKLSNVESRMLDT